MDARSAIAHSLHLAKYKCKLHPSLKTKVWGARNRMDIPGPIEHLPAATQSRLRSTQILTSLPQIISELVQNSLDAGALHVEIGVDCEEWGCWVRDDGAGISKDGLALLAGTDSGQRRYTTSKAYSCASLGQVSTFGFRGEALASAADLSCVEIASRTSSSRESWSVILKGGESLYNGPSIRWRRESPGTVVCIRDAFYNLPIRRLSHPSPSKTLEWIRKDVETVALVFPHVSFSVENTSRKAKEGRPDKARVLTVPKTSSSLYAFRHLFGRSLAEHVDIIHETLDDMSIQGFISSEGAYSKSYQYLYLNRHALTFCELHRAVDAKFAASSFAKHAYDEYGQTSQPRSSARRSPRKSEKKPVFVLNLVIPPSQVDNCLEPAKAAVHLQNSERLIAFLSSVIAAFLLRHGFATNTSRSRETSSRDQSSPSPCKRRKIEHLACDVNSAQLGRDSAPFHHGSLAPREVTSTPLITVEKCATSGEDAEVIWTDPHTGKTFVVDTRTGNSYALGATMREEGYGSTSAVQSSGRRTIGEGVTSKRKAYGDTDDTPRWIREALAANKAYTLTEPKIPSLTLSSTFTSAMGQEHTRHTCGHRNVPDGGHRIPHWTPGGPFTSSTSRFTKASLCDAEVLGQVDRKFIACIIDLGDSENTANDTTLGRQGRSLVLIDQHAADERVRVERFLTELCSGFFCRPTLTEAATIESGELHVHGVRRRLVVPPVPVLLTSHEAAQFVDSEGVRTAFERWGFSFSELEEVNSSGRQTQQTERKPESSGYVQVFVASVPEVVGDKLLAGDELRDLIKAYLPDAASFSVHSDFLNSPSQSNSQEEFIWQRAMRYCPKGLLDLVNSKACRGAIMFNDSLSAEQCRRLVRQLAETALPFQCAHGRPSLVPLANLAKCGPPSGNESNLGARITASNWAEFTSS